MKFASLNRLGTLLQPGNKKKFKNNMETNIKSETMHEIQKYQGKSQNCQNQGSEMRFFKYKSLSDSI